MLAAEKHKGTYLAPVGIGVALFIAELAGVYFTGGSLNPARSFGPCVASVSFPSDHWIYWVGPALGALIAVGFYLFVKLLGYETANPGADLNEKKYSNSTKRMLHEAPISYDRTSPYTPRRQIYVRVAQEMNRFQARADE